MSTPPINPQSPSVDNDSAVAPIQDTKAGHNTSMLILCALLLQETVNTCVRSTNIDAKQIDQTSSYMKNLDQRQRDLGNFKLVLETDTNKTWQIYGSPNFFFWRDSGGGVPQFWL